MVHPSRGATMGPWNCRFLQRTFADDRAAAPSVVQVRPATPASGLCSLTTSCAMVSTPSDGATACTLPADGQTLMLVRAGTAIWPGLRVNGLTPPSPPLSHIALAVARSWSNVVTAVPGWVHHRRPLLHGTPRRSIRDPHDALSMHDGSRVGRSAPGRADRRRHGVQPRPGAGPASIAGRPPPPAEHGQVKRGLGTQANSVHLRRPSRGSGAHRRAARVNVTSGSPRRPGAPSATSSSSSMAPRSPRPRTWFALTASESAGRLPGPAWRAPAINFSPSASARAPMRVVLRRLMRPRAITLAVENPRLSASLTPAGRARIDADALSLGADRRRAMTSTPSIPNERSNEPRRPLTPRAHRGLSSRA